MTGCCFYWRHCHFRASSHCGLRSIVFPTQQEYSPGSRFHSQAQGFSLKAGRELSMIPVWTYQLQHVKHHIWISSSSSPAPARRTSPGSVTESVDLVQ